MMCKLGQAQCGLGAETIDHFLKQLLLTCKYLNLSMNVAHCLLIVIYWEYCTFLSVNLLQYNTATL